LVSNTRDLVFVARDGTRWNLADFLAASLEVDEASNSSSASRVDVEPCLKLGDIEVNEEPRQLLAPKSEEFNLRVAHR
jgi:hypothetical protein